MDAVGGLVDEGTTLIEVDEASGGEDVESSTRAVHPTSSTTTHKQANAVSVRRRLIADTADEHGRMPGAVLVVELAGPTVRRIHLIR